MATRNSWPDRTDAQLDRESAALRNVAKLIGGADNWSDAPGLLEDIAAIISRAGMPDPGNADSIAFYADQLP